VTSAGIVAVVRIGVLTGGGDCPGLNAVIRAVVRRGIDDHGHEIVGFRDGWRGPIEGDGEELSVESSATAGRIRSAPRSTRCASTA
jgi:6-phosphofructokinase